jgi:hypothetical protein
MTTNSTAKNHLTGTEVFWLALKTGLLTVVTLGIYRFWAKTRMRQLFWAGTELDGDRFEYTGTGLEKFKGFLIAVVFLAVYLGLLQMLLLFLGLNVLREPQSDMEMAAQVGGFYLIFFALLPFILFATYRAQRYRMSRTRWRGIRFGMDSAAWGYVWRALGHGLLTLLTLGLLLPRMTFFLEKYRTDRTWFGTARFEQRGRWQDLYLAMKHLLIGLAILIVGVGVGAMVGAPAVMVLAGVVGYIWIIVGAIHYGVQSFAYLTRNKLLDGQVMFDAAPRTGFVIYTYVVGGLAAALITGVLLAVLGGIGAAMIGAFSGFEAGRGMPGFGGIAVIGLGYLASLAIGAAVAMALITRPIIAHYTDTLTVRGTDALNAIRQRAYDAGADAEGFADALDVGGAL